MANGDFWEDMAGAFSSSGLDTVLQGQEVGGEYFTQVQGLVDAKRAKNALTLPLPAGTRVRFIANLGSLLTYPDTPPSGIEGTLVTVKTADGNVTAMDDHVFVLWDDGQFRPILAEHLRLSKSSNRRANTVRIVTADLGNLSSFFSASKSADELVHKATKDLWSFKQDGGKYVIERLFDYNGKPLKV